MTLSIVTTPTGIQNFSVYFQAIKINTSVHAVPRLFLNKKMPADAGIIKLTFYCQILVTMP